jgi:Type II secretory pathway, prepilin signal peptidase PulO and related peptidases
MDIIIIPFVLAFGLVIGSFLNVCIYRIPEGESIVFGRSHCTNCGKPIASYDLIPVVSFLILGGKCRHCKNWISPRYPLIELLNALLYCGLYLRFGLTPAFGLYTLFVSCLIIITFIDIDKQMIPDRINLSILFIGILACFLSPDVIWYERIIGIGAASVPLFIAMLISKGGMGFGDVKYAAVAGIVLGFRNALFSLLLACVIGAIFGLVYTRIKGVGLKTAIPFGPFLSVSFLFTLIWGNYIIHSYLQLFRF